MTVLVTGATGSIGSELTRLLIVDGLPVRTLARSAAKLADRFDGKVDAVPIDLDMPTGLGSAMAGVETLVLITAACPNAVRHASAVLAAAQRAGVGKVVRVSAIKAAPDGPTDNTRLHAQTEAEIIAGGMDYVFLRPNYFMQNMFLVAEAIAKNHAFSFATGKGSMGMIDTRDIALCLRACILSDNWNGKALELTGPETLSFDEVAMCLSDLLGKSIRFEPISTQAAYDFVETSGWGTWMAALTRDYGAAYGKGWGDFTTEHVARLTGKAPRSFETFAREIFIPSLDLA